MDRRVKPGGDEAKYCTSARKSENPAVRRFAFFRVTTKSLNGIQKTVGNFRLAEMPDLSDNSDMATVDQVRQTSRKRADRTMRAAKPSVGKPSAKTSAATKLSSVALDMEVPLREASDAVHALRLMGYGLEGQGSSTDGRAIADVAWTACQRLEAFDYVWRRLCEIALRPRREAGATRGVRSASAR